MSKINLDDIDGTDELSGGEVFNIRNFLNRAKANWVFILISVVLGVTIAYIYLYAQTPSYRTAAKVLIKENDAAKSSPDMLQNLGLATGVNNVDNELEILRSFTIMREAVDDLGLYVTLIESKNQLRSKEFYGKASPYTIYPLITDKNLYVKLPDSTFSFSVRNNAVIITNITSGKRYRGELGKLTQLPGLNLLIERNASVPAWGTGANVLIRFNNPDRMADGLRSAINAQTSGKQTSVINIDVEGAVPARSEDLLAKVIQIYIRSGVNDRNAISDSTIAFIDGRLAGVTADLQNLEKEIQDFKQSNEIVDISSQSQALLSNAGEFYRNAAEQEVQLSVVNSLIEFMQHNSRDPRLVPASLTVDNPGLSSLIAQYNSLLLTRRRNLMSMTEENPVVTTIDGQLEEQRSNLLAGLYNLRSTARSGLSTIRQNNSAIDAQLRTVPAKEREFLEYSRQQTIKQELYLYLLQKREEAALSKSSTLSNARVIDAPRTVSAPVKPKGKLIMLLGLLAGFAFPFAWLWLRDLLNTRIDTKKDIERKTEVPIVGEIGHFKGDGYGSGLVVTEKNSRHLVVEQFRMLRSNLNYTLINSGKLILVTSSIPGEGKTFVSLNLAATFALSGKKTVIVGMDLRKPKLNKVLGMQARKGLTHYMVGEAELHEIIHPVEGVPDLRAIVCNVIPPNPAELLMSAKCVELIETLQQQFDYVVIDTAPILVTDASILSAHASVTLFISRLGYTYKQSIDELDKLQRSGRFGKLNLVVNDIKPKRYGGGYYGYSYGYGYGYGYGVEAAEKPGGRWSVRKRRKD